MTDTPPVERTLPILAVAFAAFLALFFAGLAPFNLEMPLGDMEGSWMWASVYAGLHRFAYGTQFVFTNGPLFPFYLRQYAFEATLLYVLARLALVAYLALAFALLAAGPGRRSWLTLLGAQLILWPAIGFLLNDSLMFALPFVTALLVLARRAALPVLIVGIVLSAAAGIAKISVMPFAIGAFVLVDVALLARRQAPLALLGYGVASFLLFIAAGQSPGQFIPFLVGSYEMTAGYSAALSKDGPLLELLAWLAVNAAIIVALLVPIMRERRPDDLLRLLLVAGFAFIALKAGFVRHDGHSLAAWGCTLLCVVLLGLPGTLPQWRPRIAIIAYALPLLLPLVLLVYFIVTPQARLATAKSFTDLALQSEHLAAFASNPSAWLAGQDQRAEAEAASIRAEQAVPALIGKVDAIANMQSAVLAAGLDYWPRPTIQENMTVTPALIERNRAFLSGPDAPDYLFFAPGATDNRHPASVEGALWPLLLSRYDVEDNVRDLLLLKKRGTPRDIVATEVTRTSIGFGETLTLPAGSPLLLKLDISRSLFGRLADAAFKPPQVSLTLNYEDGSSQSFRLIPGMIADGMVISPTIETIAQYRALAEGSVSNAKRVTGLRVDSAGVWAYAPAIGAIVETLTIPTDH